MFKNSKIISNLNKLPPKLIKIIKDFIEKQEFNTYLLSEGGYTCSKPLRL